MKRLLLAAVAALAACERTPSPGAIAPSVQGDAAAMTAAPALAFSHRKLANGLSVYAMPDASTANVAVHVWYDVGSKDDPAGRSGFAHLFEHIMFKATRNMPAEMFDRLTEDVGGFNNASTYDDFTNYYAVVPANHLERILWAEAERMGSLVVDDAIFQSERDVVKEELRQRVLASPYGRLFNYLAMTNYDVHPYARPGIGSIEDLDASTVEDVRAFHATYYRPDNAVLVVSGAFSEADLDRWVDKYFGPIATPAQPIPRVSVIEPPRTAAREFTTYAPNVPLPAAAVSWPGIAGRDADTPALMVLDAILSRGESSRLYQTLVYDMQIASEAFTFSEPTADPSAYTLAAIMSEGRDVNEGVAALKAAARALADAPVSDAELFEAKNEILTEKLEARETAFGRGFELAESVIRFRDPRYADALLNAVAAVTAADVQRIARRLFVEDRAVTIRYMDESARPTPEAGDIIAVAPSVVAGALNLDPAAAPIVTLAPEASRIAPPEAGSPVSARIPETHETTLGNGLKVIVAPKREVPLVSIALRFRGGDGADPAGLYGLADLTADLVTKGTERRSAVDIAQEIEALGASLSAGADADSSTITLLVRTDSLNAGMEIFADVTRNPSFDEDELERVRQQGLDDLRISLRQPGSIASRAATRVLFADGPYGRVASPNSLSAVTAAATRDFHRRHWRADGAVLVITGDVSPSDGFAMAERMFGDWSHDGGRAQSAPTAAPPSGPRRIVIDMPGSGQAAVYYGFVGADRRSADYFPAAVAVNVLGGGYSSRLNTEIRIKRGLSYGAGASLPPRLGPAPILAGAQTRNDAAVEVAGLIGEELRRLAREPVDAAELTARKAVLIGSFGRNVETTQGLAAEISNAALFGLPMSSLSRYVADVSAVSAADVGAAAAQYFDPAQASIIVVGDAAVFFDAFRRVYSNAERIPLDGLNFDSASLR